jgi:hypothetical protein
MTLCFEAPTAAGPLRLTLPDEPGDAVTAALALSAHEPAVAALEEWLQQALDPQPVPAEGHAPSLLWADAGGLRIGVPWALLQAQTRAPQAAWVWPELVFQVDIATFETVPTPPAKDADVLLLPPSFETPWRVRLHDERHELAANAEWQGPDTELRLLAAPVHHSAPRPACRVELIHACRRPLPDLLGWQPPTQPWRPGAQATLKLPEGQALSGRIAPALQGFGLWVHRG